MVKNKLKILHIVAGDLTGGAARGAYWLHQELKNHDIDSKVLISGKATLGDGDVISIAASKIDKLLCIIRLLFDRLPLIIYQNRKKLIFSSGLTGYDFTKTKEYKTADIIHLHWINDGFVNIRHLSVINKPIVWTMRDMWPMTGGCHYAMDCTNFDTGCGNCRQLNSSYKLDLSRFVLNRKKKYLPKNIEIIGISHWLSNKAKSSSLFKNYNVRTIYNNINIREFFPIKKELAQHILGIDTNKKIILVGAIKINDYYKGFDKYQKALRLLDNDKYFLCFFGEIDKSLVEVLGFEYRIFNYLYDYISLRLVYSCADVFVAPSVMDAFGKTLAESMACGTPVVCFDATGPKDIVTHKNDGYKAVPFDEKDLAKGIEWVLNSPNYSALSQNARDKAVREFDSRVVAKKYITLYQDILDKQSAQ